MPKNPFEFIDNFEDIDLEQNPVTQAAQKVAGQATVQVQATAKAAAAQVTPDQSIVNALYGAGASDASNGEQGTEQPVQNQQQQNPQATPQATDAGAQVPDEQAKLQETRQLLKAHMENYGTQFTLEAELRRVRSQKQQEEQARLQAQADEAEKKQQEAQAKAQSTPAPQGKRQGVPDFVLKREQNKAEQNRGTSG